MNDNEKHLDLAGLALFWEKLKAKLSLKADKTELPTKISQLTNDSGYITVADLPDSDTGNETVTFTAATTRAAIASGEKLSVMMGKLAKYMADFGSLAFKSTVAKTDLASDVQSSLAKADTALQSIDAEALYAKKSDVTGIYKYKGSKSTVTELPAEDNTVGDVWNVEATNMNYGWTGSAWDPLGQIFSVTTITAEEIETIMAG